MTTFAPVLYLEPCSTSQNMIRSCIDMISQYQVKDEFTVDEIEHNDTSLERLDVLYNLDPIRSLGLPTIVKTEYAPFMSIICRYDVPKDDVKRKSRMRRYIYVT
jgi:hypothetical protein